MVWSKKYKISEYLEAPNKAGVYMIGIPNGFHYEAGQKKDDYLGENFPEDFEPMYIGISKRSVRSRLYCHYKGSGNKNARDYIKGNGNGNDNVFFVYYESLNTEIEDVFLIGLVNGFPWNVKRSERGNFLKQFIQPKGRE